MTIPNLSAYEIFFARAAFAFLFAAFALAAAPAVAAPCAGFFDVDDADPFCTHVEWMKNRNITLGCTANQYCPDSAVTRLQMAAFMSRLGNVVFQQGGNAYGATAVLGTVDDQPVDIHANGGRVMRYDPHPTSPNLIGGHPNNTANAGTYGQTVAGGGRTGSDCYELPGGTLTRPCMNRANARYVTIGGGVANLAGGEFATVAGGLNSSANGVSSVVAGGEYHFVTGAYASVGGGRLNAATADRTTIAGGESNVASANYATIGGGRNNVGSAFYATIGGGDGNTAFATDSTVAGGRDNDALAVSATIGGGTSNVANGTDTTIGGGNGNLASGAYATIPGGTLNQAIGNGSFVAGRNGTATENGMFVWSDSRGTEFNPALYRAPGQSSNTFNVRATGVGGVWFVTGANASGVPTWACYAQNGSGWTCASDRNLKRNLERLDGEAVLAKLTAMPIYQWQPKDGPNAEVKHLGPMAQDFHAAFGLGDSDKSIGFQDADGVALAAIQGLNAKLETTLAEITELRRRHERELAKLRRTLDVLMARTLTDNVLAHSGSSSE